MKKLISVLLVLVFAFSFAACNGKTTAPTQVVNDSPLKVGFIYLHD